MIHLKNNVSKTVFLVPAVILLLTAGFLQAESFWEGSITTANYGTLPEEGLFGASNAFPLNSRVVVTNPVNGKQVEILVIKRLDNPSLFLALSKDAGSDLGIERGSMINGTVSLKTSDINGNHGGEDNLLSLDPEINPAAGSENGELALIEDYIKNELGETEITAASKERVEPVLPEEELSDKQEQPVKTDAVSKVDKQPAGVPEEKTEFEQDTAAVPEEQPELKTEVPDTPSLSNIPVASPDKEIADFTLPPLPELSKEEAKAAEIPEALEFTLPDAVEEKKTFRVDSLPGLTLEEKETPEVLSLIASPDEKMFTPPEVAVPDISGEETVAADVPRIVSLKEAPAAESVIPASVSIPEPEIKELEAAAEVEEVLKPSIPEPGEVEIVLKPAEPKPPKPSEESDDQKPQTDKKSDTPELKPEITKEITAEAVNKAVEDRGETEVSLVGNYTLTGKLEKNAYYLQLGAYNEEYAARGFADTLTDKFPVTVLVGNDRDRVSYKVMVGPLNQDEGGTLLFNFKAEGYKDAFLRKGK